jgi:transcriptional regulator with XRE-family HTH domain
MASFGERVRAAREKRGWSQDQLARVSGTTQSTIDRIEKSETRQSRKVFDVAAALDIDPPLPLPRERISPTEGERTLPEWLLVGRRDLPVYAVAEGGPGAVIVSTDAIEYVRRPTPLETEGRGYGMYILGESMSPAFESGDVALVHPRLPPARGTDVVLYQPQGGPGQDGLATVKRLLKWTDEEWALRQFNPLKEFTLKRAEWPVCHRIVGKYARR